MKGVEKEMIKPDISHLKFTLVSINFCTLFYPSLTRKQQQQRQRFLFLPCMKKINLQIV